MADITPARQNIPLAGSQFLAAVSEYQQQSLGGNQNYINYFQHSEKQFFLNGTYGVAVVPVTGVDGLAVFEFNAQIIDVWMFNLVPGTSGATELDVLVATAPGGSFTSIFSTKPQISYNAGANVWVGCPNPSLIGPAYSPPTYVAPANTVAPILNSTITNNILATTAIRCDLITVQAGGASAGPQNCGILVHYRPFG